MDHLERIDIFHTRFIEFARVCSVPGARILAAARFITAIQDDSDGMDFYLEEPSRILLKLLNDFPDAVTDTGQIDTINTALHILRRSGRTEFEDMPNNGSYPRQQAKTSGGRTLARVQIPLVCELPPVPGNENAAYFGVAMTLTVAPQVCANPHDRIIWHNRNTDIKSNRLRLLSDVAAEARMTCRHVIYELFVQPKLGAALKFLSPINISHMDIDRLGFELSLSDKEMPIAGASISLGLGAAMYGAMVGLMRKGRALAPKETLAWTGILKSSGEVKGVDRHSLRDKIQAIAVAGFDGIVVARSQGSLACQFAEELGWSGTVFTVGHLSDVINHSELMVEAVLPGDVVHGCRRYNLQHYSGTALLFIVMLGLLFYSPRILDGLGVYWFPWWRPVPQITEIPPIQDFYHGFDLYIPRMDDLRLVPDVNRTFAFAQIVDTVYDFQEPGPYLVVGESADCKAGKDGRLKIFHIPTRQVVTEGNIKSTSLPDDPGREESVNLYTIKQGIVADIDNDGENEVVLSISFNPTSICILQILDHNLQCERALKHIGHLEHLDACDVNGDGRLEIVSVGFHGPTDGMSLLVASIEDFYPSANLDLLNPPSIYTTAGLPWDVNNQPCYAHFVIPYRDWMMALPPEGPWMQLGKFGLSMPARDGASCRVRASASFHVSPSDILMDFDLNSPAKLDSVFWGQVVINRLNEMIVKDILPSDVLEVYLQDIYDVIHHSTTIWIDETPDETQ